LEKLYTLINGKAYENDTDFIDFPFNTTMSFVFSDNNQEIDPDILKYFDVDMNMLVSDFFFMIRKNINNDIMDREKILAKCFTDTEEGDHLRKKYNALAALLNLFSLKNESS
jgi:hypothetical protein